MSSDTDENLVSRSITRRVDAECIVASALHDIRFGDRVVEECIHMGGAVVGPQEENNARVELQCHRDFTNLTIKLKEGDLPDNEVDFVGRGLTTLADYGSQYERYGRDIGTAVAVELGLKPDTVSDAVSDEGDMRFTQEHVAEREYSGSLEVMKFTCAFETECFWELDEMWDDTD